MFEDGQGRGFTVIHIYGSSLKYLSLPLPSDSEQTAIAEYLDRATADIDTTIAQSRRQVGLFTEYRTRLIADVVTGKLDVREAAAAALPEIDPLAADDNLDGTLNTRRRVGATQSHTVPEVLPIGQ